MTYKVKEALIAAHAQIPHSGKLNNMAHELIGQALEEYDQYIHIKKDEITIDDIKQILEDSFEVTVRIEDKTKC